MKKFRFLFTGLTLALLCGMLLVACQNEELTIEDQTTLIEETADQLSMRASDGDADADVEAEETNACELGLRFLPMDDERQEIYESEGLEALLAHLEIEGEEVSPDACVVDSDKRYCNYEVAQVLDPPNPITPYPGAGWRFCVVCPPLCGPFGLLYSVRPVLPNGTHYVAYVKLNQNGPSCEKCHSNTVVP